MSDLFVLCACLDGQAVLEAVLSRHQSLGIRAVTAHVEKYQLGGDGALRRHGVGLLANIRNQYRHGLLVFDHHGCNDHQSACMIEQEIDEALQADWGDRARVVICEPEIEEWVIGAHGHLPSVVPQLAGVDVRGWMEASGLWAQDQAKPAKPKAALAALFRHHRVTRSSAIYRKLAARGSLRVDRCHSRSFRHLIDLLRRWFPADPAR